MKKSENIYILCLLFWVIAQYLEKSKIIQGEPRFISLVAVYSIGIILALVSIFIVIKAFITKKYQKKILVAVILFTIAPLLGFISHSIDYYKDLFSGKAVFQSDVYFTEEFHFIDKGKTVTIDYEGKSYTLLLTDEMYYELTENNPLDKSRTVKYLLAEIYPNKYPARITFHKNTGIVCDVQIITD